MLSAFAIEHVGTTTATKVHFSFPVRALLKLRQEPHRLPASTTLRRFVGLNPCRRTEDLPQNLAPLAARFLAPRVAGRIVIVQGRGYWPSTIPRFTNCDTGLRCLHLR